MFPQVSLREAIKQRSHSAKQSGALKPIETDIELVMDADIEFMIRVATGLQRKDEANRQTDLRDARSPLPASPFLNPDPRLFIADVADSHRCLLNKFNVVDEHLLIVTKEFEQQQNPLNFNDFVALWTCMREYEALAFYNSVAEAGASQSHKHLQMVPLPLSPGSVAIPIEAVLPASFTEGITCCNALPFLHRWASFQGLSENVREMASASLTIYTELLKTVGYDPQSPGPYNLLQTRQWMLIVPRSRECFHSISLNALAFAGSLFVRNQQQLEEIKSRGPMTALREVGFH